MKKTGINRNTFNKVMKYLKPQMPLIVITLVLALASVGLTLYLPILTGDAVDLILDTEATTFWTSLLKLLLKMIIAVVATAVVQRIMNRLNNKIVYRVIKSLRNDAFARLQRLPLSFLDQRPHGDMVSRMVSDVDQFADGLLIGFTQLFTGVMTILCTLVFMVRVNLPVTLVVVLVTPLSLFVASFIAKRTHDMFKLQSETRGEQTALINETIGNMKTVAAYGREESVHAHFDEINGRLQKYSLRAIFFSSLVNPCTRFVNSLVYAGVAFSGGFAAIRGAMTVGQLTCLLSYANQYTKPFNEISGVITELQNAFVCADRIFELIEAETEPEDAPAELTDVSGNVDIKDVSFSYTPDKRLIENFNLSVKPGERIAIVGPTGCGKTTVINLLMRFYDVNLGSISVDGSDIREVTRRSLRDNYGMVLQETWLKQGTVRENICFGCDNVSDEQMIEAAKATHAHSFIRRLPNGYDTVLSENGGGLSEGQKQLLCITRVMLSVPSMLILDEATSSIDTRTEHRIQEAFATMMKGRTSFIVAHRLSTIQNADKILVMRDGHVIDQGKHEELLAKEGFYYRLYNSQFAN